jgi:nickel-dependent lactate racemase
MDEGTHPHSIRPAKGIHITVPWEKVRNDIAAIVPVRKDRRSIFVVPWGDFTYIGTTTRGVVVKLNRHVTAADKVILTGGIVYHSMAGFAGGRKSIIPGIASYGTIQANHRFCLSDEIGGGVSPLCDCGRLAGNPLHEDQMEIAAMLAPAFLLNAIAAPGGGFAGFVAGHWRDAWE